MRAGLAVLLVVVFGIKAAMFPFFFWLPDSYPTAPSPVTAIFAGLLTKVGVYALIRTQTLLFPPDTRPVTVMLVLAGITMLVGVFGAIAQGDVKRVLSFQIVSHIGYMVMGSALFTVTGLAAAVLYIVHHIVAKTALFLTGGLIEHTGGSSRLTRLGGMVNVSPVLAVLFLVPALSARRRPRCRGSCPSSRSSMPLAAGSHYGIMAVALPVEPAHPGVDDEDLELGVLGACGRARRTGGLRPGRAFLRSDAPARRSRVDGDPHRRPRVADRRHRDRRRAAARAQRPRRDRSAGALVVHPGGARTMTSVGLVVVLTAIWVLLWGSLSPANVISGLAMSVVLLLLLPGARRRSHLPVIRAGGAAATRRLPRCPARGLERGARAGEVLTPIADLDRCGAPSPCRDASDELLTVMANLMAMAPGTIPVEVSRDPAVIYVHVLHLRRVEDVAAICGGCGT